MSSNITPYNFDEERFLRTFSCLTSGEKLPRRYGKTTAILYHIMNVATSIHSDIKKIDLFVPNIHVCKSITSQLIDICSSFGVHYKTSTMNVVTINDTLVYISVSPYSQSTSSIRGLHPHLDSFLKSDKVFDYTYSKDTLLVQDMFD